MTERDPATADDVRRIRQDGFTILEGVIPPADVPAVPGSHRFEGNPSAATMAGIDRDAPYPAEFHAEGAAGSVLLYDSRMWHAVPPNCSGADRVALIVRYAPWWLNLEPAREGSAEHTAMVVETGGKNYAEPEVFRALPDHVKPLYRHWVARG